MNGDGGTKGEEQPPAHGLARLYLKGMNDDARQNEIDQQDGQGLAVGAAQLARPYEGEAHEHDEKQLYRFL